MSKVRYFYYGDRSKVNHNGIVTVAYNIDKEQNQLVFGLSFCSPKDRFNKKIGREIARGRMKVKPIYFPCRKGDGVIRTIILFLTKYYEEVNNIPKWYENLLRGMI